MKNDCGTGRFRHPKAGQVLESPVFRRLWIVSGGQSGVDRAAIDFAIAHSLPTRGWCPSGRAAEDGRIAEHFPVQECPDSDPALRTELNAFDSDATLILSYDEVRDGTVLTEECAKRFERPCLFFDMSAEPAEKDVREFRGWIDQHLIRILNIAGPRESFRPGQVYSQASIWLSKLLET